MSVKIVRIAQVSAAALIGSMIAPAPALADERCVAAVAAICEVAYARYGYSSRIACVQGEAPACDQGEEPPTRYPYWCFDNRDGSVTCTNYPR